MDDVNYTVLVSDTPPDYLDDWDYYLDLDDAADVLGAAMAKGLVDENQEKYEDDLNFDEEPK